MLHTERSGPQALASWLCYILLINIAHAFFPTPWKAHNPGWGAVSHIEQTDQVFESLAAKYFPTIPTLTKTMIKARDAIHDANAAVDEDQSHSALHFDGENFDEGQKRLTDLQGQVIASLQAGKAEDARKALGGALHTLQDFYAHSNWVELGNSAIFSDLGRGTTITHAAFTDATCKACGPPENPGDPVVSKCPNCRSNDLGFGGLLTSGYYFGEDSPPGGAPIPSNKCHHGGFTDNPKGAVFGILFGDPNPGINKDSLNCNYSPHFFHHSDAVTLAIQATTQYIEDIKGKITEKELKLLFGVGSTLAFVIDTTGSMGDIINSVQEQSIQIVTDRLGTPDEPSIFVISPFNDPTTGPVTVTSDFDTFKSTILDLTADGGGDCPELSMQGILNAIEVLDEGASLFMMTDAASKDADLASQVIIEANAKNINIYPFKFDSNCDDGLMRRSDSLSNKVYGAVAAATGGQYHSLPRGDVGKLTGLLDSLSQGDSAFVLKITDIATSTTPLTYKFPVDSTMTNITLSLRGAGVTMALTQPDGSALSHTGTGVSSTTLTDGHFVTIKSPAVGGWAVQVTGPGNFTLDVTGTTSVHFSFTFVEIRGTSGHAGYFPIAGSPTPGTNSTAIAVIDGSFSNATFDLRSPAGTVMLDPAMLQGSGEFGFPPNNSFFGEMQLPPGSLYAYLTGLDGAHKPFQRVMPSVIAPLLPNSTTNSTTNSTNTTIPSSTAPFANQTYSTGGLIPPSTAASYRGPLATGGQERDVRFTTLAMWLAVIVFGGMLMA